MPLPGSPAQGNARCAAGDRWQGGVRVGLMGWATAGFLAGLALGVGAGLLLRRSRRPDVAGPDPRVAELSELAGGLAHEIRNPLSTLMVNLQLLAEELRDLPEDVPGASVVRVADVRRRGLIKVDAVRREAQRLQHLLDDFLRLAGPCRLNRAPVDLNRTIQDLVEFFAPQADAAGVRLRVVCHPGPLRCPLDEPLMKQALLNILINAQQAMPEGGDIMIRTRRHGQNTADAEISDTGPGIPPEMQGRVLRPFFSTKVGGTGLGLSTTHRIVAEHGGQLLLHSEPGRGTLFTVRLPLVDAASRRDSRSGQTGDSVAVADKIGDDE